MTILEIVISLKLIAKWEYDCVLHRGSPNVQMAGLTLPGFLMLIEKGFHYIFITNFDDIIRLCTNSFQGNSNTIDIIINCINSINVEADFLITEFSTLECDHQVAGENKSTRMRQNKNYNILLKFFVKLIKHYTTELEILASDNMINQTEIIIKKFSLLEIRNKIPIINIGESNLQSKLTKSTTLESLLSFHDNDECQVCLDHRIDQDQDFAILDGCAHLICLPCAEEVFTNGKTDEKW